MMVSNFRTEYYGDKKLTETYATSELNLMIISNFSMESYDGKQLQY